MKKVTPSPPMSLDSDHIVLDLGFRPGEATGPAVRYYPGNQAPGRASRQGAIVPANNVIYTRYRTRHQPP